VTADPQGPSPMPRQDLSAFATPRGVAAPKLAPRRRAEASPVPPPAPPAVEPEDAMPPSQPLSPEAPGNTAGTNTRLADTPSRPRAATATAGRGKSPRTPGADEPKPTGQIIAYLKDPVADRLRAAQTATRRTYLQLIIDAVDATHTELPELLETAGYIARRSNSLFGDGAHGVRQHGSGERKQQIGLRPPAAVLAVIDQLVIDCGAPHRSALIEVALDSHLASPQPTAS